MPISWQWGSSKLEKPGQAFLSLSPDVQKQLSELKSEDMANIRPDVGALFQSREDFNKELQKKELSELKMRLEKK